jgi:hypothetical protein
VIPENPDKQRSAHHHQGEPGISGKASKE